MSLSGKINFQTPKYILYIFYIPYFCIILVTTRTDGSCFHCKYAVTSQESQQAVFVDPDPVGYHHVDPDLYAVTRILTPHALSELTVFLLIMVSSVSGSIKKISRLTQDRSVSLAGFSTYL